MTNVISYFVKLIFYFFVRTWIKDLQTHFSLS